MVRQRRWWHLRRWAIPYVVLIAGLGATAAAAWQTHTTGRREEALEVESAGEAVRAAVQNRIDAHLAVLLGAAGLFAASEDVTEDEFGAYVSRMELPRRYPGIQGLGFSRRIQPGERERVLLAMRRSVPGLERWPASPSAAVTAVVYIEPRDRRNLPLLGFDMGSERTCRAALDLARDSGAATATGLVTLEQEGAAPADRQPGFLIYVPVYHRGGVPATVEARQADLLGFVFSQLRVGDLLTGVLAAHEPTLGFDLFDGPADRGQLLHRTAQAPGATYRATRTVDVAGRTWHLYFQSPGMAAPARTRVLVSLILLGGTALSLLLLAVTHRQVAGRTAAERTADGLRESEERLLASEREKEAFLAVISHELRTPLNAIVGWASMLGRGAVPPDTQAHAIAVIKRNAAAQTRLIEDLLDMSRAVAGQLSLQITDVDARATLDAAVDALRPSAEAAGLTLHIDFNSDAGIRLGVVEADAGRLQQIVMNLLGNSIKFTPRGGQVWLYAERNLGLLTIRVTDTGIGIPPEFVPFLFDRFRQADSSPTRAYSGTGLGLAIVRHLVHLHGGTIEAVSAGVNKGAAFTVRLPVTRRRKTGLP